MNGDPSASFYPQGPAALHPDWPNARFTVSGLGIFDTALVNFLHIVQEQFACAAPVESIHGAPAIAWNAGRLSAVAMDPAQLRRTTDALHARGAGCFATFTNHLLTERDLDDPASNFLLDILARRPDLNGVIVASDLLSDYIARRHPALRQVASIVKVAVEGGRGDADYYRCLSGRFWRCMLHPDDAHNLSLLEKLDPDRFEVLVNEHCRLNCPTRVTHYDKIAAVQRAAPRTPHPPGRIAAIPPDTCLLAASGQSQDAAARSCALSRPELKRIYDMGFRHFKLQGRGGKFPAFAYDLARYTLEPDVAQPFVFQWMIHKVSVES